MRNNEIRSEADPSEVLNKLSNDSIDMKTKKGKIILISPMHLWMLEVIENQ